ncbi:MAG: family 16 glycosylhydrolase [bacterium]
MKKHLLYIISLMITLLIFVSSICYGQIDKVFADHFADFDENYWVKMDAVTKTWPSANIGKPKSFNISNQNDTELKLKLNNENNNYFTSEIQSKSFFGYGTYKSRLKVSKGDGIINAFFLYSDTTNKEEIDFELFAKKGVNGHYYVMVGFFIESSTKHIYEIVDLGSDNINIDPTDGYHNYTIEWHSNYLMFYIDSKLIWAYLPYKTINCYVNLERKDVTNIPLPTRAMNIIFNHWIADGYWYPTELGLPGQGRNFKDSTEMLIDYVQYLNSESNFIDNNLFNQNNLLSINPNPILNASEINFILDNPSKVTLTVSNNLGIEVKRLFDNAYFEQGTNKISLCTSELPSGVYYCTMSSETNRITKSFLIVR